MEREVWLLRTGFGIAPVNKLVSLTWLLWALRSFRSFTLHLHYITLASIHPLVTTLSIFVSLWMRLGFSHLSMTSHITGLVRTSFFAILRQLRSVSRSLTQDATCQLVQSFILNVAFAGWPQRSIIRLKVVINAAARLVLRVKKSDPISTLMRDELQWLRIGKHMRFKFFILLHKCLNNSAPPYLVDKPLSDNCNRSRLWSSNSSDVFVPRTKSKMGDGAFEVAGLHT